MSVFSVSRLKQHLSRHPNSKYFFHFSDTSELVDTLMFRPRPEHSLRAQQQAFLSAKIGQHTARLDYLLEQKFRSLGWNAITIPSGEIERSFLKALNHYLKRPQEYALLLLTRFNPALKDHEGNCFRFRVSRDVKNIKRSSPFFPSFEQQLENFEQFAGNRQIVMIDDLSVTGGTLSLLRTELGKKNLRIAKELVFMRVGDQSEDAIINLSPTQFGDAVETRDLLGICGKVVYFGDTAGESKPDDLCSPYLFPHRADTDGVISLNDAAPGTAFLDLSARIMKATADLFSVVQRKLKLPLITFSDLRKARLPLPQRLDGVTPIPRTTLKNYFIACRKIAQESPLYLFFDLDNSLYSDPGTFLECRLGKAVRKKTAELLVQCGAATSPNDGEHIFDEAFRHEIANPRMKMSVYFARICSRASGQKMTRKDILEKTWGQLNPDEIIRESPETLETLQILLRGQKESFGRHLYLLSAAPPPWIPIALKKLGLDEIIFGKNLLWADSTVTKAQVMHRVLKHREGSRAAPVARRSILFDDSNRTIDLINGRTKMSGIHLKSGPHDLFAQLELYNW